MELTREELIIIEENAKQEQMFQTAMRKFRKSLLDKGYNIIDVTYAIKLYTKLRELNLLESKYFKVEQEGKKVPLVDFGTLSNHPEFFYDVIMVYLNSDDFISEHELSFSDGELTVKARAYYAEHLARQILAELKKTGETSINKEKVESSIGAVSKDKEKDLKKILYILSRNGIKILSGAGEEEVEEVDLKIESDFKSPFDEEKVAEDENYVTYIMSNPQMAQSFREFFRRVWSGDKPSPKHNASSIGVVALQPGWCIASESGAAHHYFSEKHFSTDVWYATYTKKHPVDVLIDVSGLPINVITGYIEGNRSLQPHQQEAFAEALDCLGECFLHNTEPLDNRSRNTSVNPGKEKNLGYHNFRNSPHHGVSEKDRRLKPKTSYTYQDLDSSLAAEPAFSIAGSKLLRYRDDDKKVTIPEGVAVISEGAFKDKKNMEEVILPQSTIIIESGAFINCPKLRYVRATNNLRAVGKRAFYGTDMENLVLAVFSFKQRRRDGGFDISAKRPINLEYLPKELERWGGREETVTENSQGSSGPTIKLPFLFKEGDLFDIENGIVYPRPKEEVEHLFEENSQYAKEVVIPEGARVFSSELKEGLYVKTKSLRFPKSFESLDGFILHNDSSVDTVNLFSTKTTTIPSGAFSRGKVGTVVSPRVINVIQAESFSPFVRSIVIPASIKSIDKKAFKGCLALEEIITDSIEKLNQALEEQLEVKKRISEEEGKAYEKLNKEILDNPFIELKEG